MIWEYKECKDISNIKKYSSKYQLSEEIIKIILGRGIREEKDIEDFINPTLSKLRDPFEFENMEHAINKIIENKKHKIFIYGDYDVDGITSAAFLTIVMRNAGIDVDYYIPDRIDEGYGLNKSAINFIKSKNGKLIITVDVGVNSEEEIEYANSLGIEVIITDHHQTFKSCPKNIITINPKTSVSYEFKFLSGAGVALKVAEALYKKLNLNKNLVYDYIDITMIGTVADVVPMIDENRVIVKNGLVALKNTKIKGLTYLLNYLRLKDKDITTTDVSYFISPLLNALGRITNSKIGVDFFIEQDEFTIYNIIEEMKNANKKRRLLEKYIFDEINNKLGSSIENMKYIFLKSDKWHPGVIGVVAAKLSIKYNIPVVLVSLKDNYGRASCRSINGINIFEILKEISDYFLRFGGHDLAAGFIAKESNLPLIEAALNERIKYSNLTVSNEKKINFIDLCIDLNKIDEKFMDEIKRIAPLGIDNPQPIFFTKNINFTQVKKFGIENQHFKAFIKKGNKIYPAIGFNLGAKSDIISENKTFDIVYYPENYEDFEIGYFQIKIKDFAESGTLNDIFIKEATQ